MTLTTSARSIGRVRQLRAFLDRYSDRAVLLFVDPFGLSLSHEPPVN